MIIDVDKLREDMKSEAMGAFFGGGCGAALVEATEIEKASPQKLVKLAEQKRIDLRKYEVPENE